ncbi:MAG: winged helix-turn-helix transcriptional regulator [Roseburia sp.]|nr:winged helix-turn-helix transcriptional regulator [Roseburia sp.]
MNDSLSKSGNVGYKLRLLHNQLHNRMEYQKSQNEFECGDLTRMQRFTIGYMYRNRDRDIYQRDLEAEFAISRATASNMLAVMERKGLIKREPVEHDARLKKLVLTEQSMRLYQRVEQDIRETEEVLTLGLSEEDKRCLHQYLDIMIQNLVGDSAECTTRCCENDTE